MATGWRRRCDKRRGLSIRVGGRAQVPIVIYTYGRSIYRVRVKVGVGVWDGER